MPGLPWRAVCQRSAPLGLDGYRLYRQLAPDFGVAIEQGTHGLWLVCGLRLKPDSGLYAAWAKLKTLKTPIKDSFIVDTPPSESRVFRKAKEYANPWEPQPK